MSDPKVPSSAIALAGLAMEYCRTLENLADAEAADFCAAMLRYLPRIYITAFDIKEEAEDNGAIADELEEDHYDTVRNGVSALLGENDMYLDTSVEDMRYSDTPVAVSLAEQLADIFQTAFDLVHTMRQAPSEAIPDIMADFKYRFDSYLSETICAAQKALNYLYQKEYR